MSSAVSEGPLAGRATGPLAGRVALVTGATSGIGTAIARRLHADGASVVVTGRSADRGGRLVSELGPRCHFHPADLAAEDAAPELLEECRGAFGGTLDILVNNAALDHTGDLLATPMAEIRATFEVNTFAAIRLLQAAGDAMKATGGSIVNVTSRLASVGVPTMAVYSASKGAILALTRAAAIELAPFGIRVNAVAPGMTRTPLYEAWVARQPVPPDPAAQVPLGRLAVPEDVASAVAYLASDDAGYVTGASIPVDGGYTAQ